MATVRRGVRLGLAAGAAALFILAFAILLIVRNDSGDKLPASGDTPGAGGSTPGTGEPSPANPASSPTGADPSGGPASTGTRFLETFDGVPASPQPWCSDAWDIAVSSRDVGTLYQLDPIDASHGEDCGPPPNTHHVDSYAGAVFSCRDHVMTAINASGYGVIYLTPNHMVDFSGGEAVIRFDLSTFRHSARDWIDIWLTPWDENLQLPLEEWLPDLQGVPRNAIHIRMDGARDNTQFRAEFIRDFEVLDLEYIPVAMHDKVPASERDRSTFDLRISGSRLWFGVPKYGYTAIDTSLPAFDWRTAVVQFGHHSYTPTKDDAGEPGTWHWDNIEISPAIPFSIANANRRFVTGETEEAQEVEFAAPATAKSHLRFSALGQIEVSFDGGKSWVKAERQSEEVHAAEHFSSYWTPIPEGTKTVLFRGGPDDWFEMWFAKDFAIWSPG